MSIRVFMAPVVSPLIPTIQWDQGVFIPVITMDDVTGIIYVGGKAVTGMGNSGTVTNTAGALTQFALMIGNGINDAKTLAALGTSGQALLSNGPGVAPSFQNIPSAVNYADSEAPSGAINGSNVTYTLAHTPNPVGSLLLFANGIKLKSTVGYNLSGNTISMVTALNPGGTLEATYRY